MAKAASGRGEAVVLGTAVPYGTVPAAVDVLGPAPSPRKVAVVLLALPQAVTGPTDALDAAKPDNAQAAVPLDAFHVALLLVGLVA